LLGIGACSKYLAPSPRSLLLFIRLRLRQMGFITTYVIFSGHVYWPIHLSRKQESEAPLNGQASGHQQELKTTESLRTFMLSAAPELSFDYTILSDKKGHQIINRCPFKLTEPEAISGLLTRNYFPHFSLIRCTAVSTLPRSPKAESRK
jgi:hypothetical protein